MNRSERRPALEKVVLQRGRCKECILYVGEVRGGELWNWKRTAAAVSHFVSGGVESIDIVAHFNTCRNGTELGRCAVGNCTIGSGRQRLCLIAA
jgi:hypothetical protein